MTQSSYSLATVYVSMFFAGASAEQMSADNGALPRRLAAVAVLAAQVPSTNVIALTWSNIVLSSFSAQAVIANRTSSSRIFERHSLHPFSLRRALLLRLASSTIAAVCNATVNVTSTSAVLVTTSLQFSNADLSDMSLIISLGLAANISLPPMALRILVVRALAFRIQATLPTEPASLSVLLILANCSGVQTNMTAIAQPISYGTPQGGGEPSESGALSLALVLGLTFGLGLGLPSLVTAILLIWGCCRRHRRRVRVRKLINGAKAPHAPDDAWEAAAPITFSVVCPLPATPHFASVNEKAPGRRAMTPTGNVRVRNIVGDDESPNAAANGKAKRTGRVSVRKLDGGQGPHAPAERALPAMAPRIAYLFAPMPVSQRAPQRNDEAPDGRTSMPPTLVCRMSPRSS